MRGAVSVSLIFVLAMGIAGCGKKGEEGKVPVTTSSDEARKEFIEGRGLAENLLSTDALPHFDRAISLDPDFATAYLYRANYSPSTKEIFSSLEKAKALSSKCSEGERLQILAYEAGVNAKTEQQKEYYQKLLALYPKDERVLWNLGRLYYGQQDISTAIEQYKKAIAIAPGFSPAYNNLGYAYRDVENYSQAEDAFKKYIELVPNDPNPYDSYAELLLKIGRFDESIANYQKAIQVDPHFVNSYAGIAANYMYKAKPDSGSAELKKLAAMARNVVEYQQAVQAQVVLYVDAGKMDPALQELEKLYLLDEKRNDESDMAADLGTKGAILLEMGKADEALAAYEKSAQLVASSDLSQEIKDNARLNLHYNRAAAAIGKNDLKKANEEAELFRIAAEAGNNTGFVQLSHELAGRIALAGKNNDKAIEELLRAGDQNPYNFYRLALAYKANGNKVKAGVFCNKATHFNSLPLLNYAFIRLKAKRLLSSL
jgi:tetratricopeptide (TPR) repeat protein